MGIRIAPSADLATLPIAIQIIGIASAAIPASFLMSKIGRKLGFLFGTLLGISATLLAAYAIFLESFILFVTASFFIGNYIAFLQQFRFAVAESVSQEEVPRSLSILMLAGIVAALLGPEVGRRFSEVGGLPLYVGSFLGLALMLSISFLILLLFYKNTNVEMPNSGIGKRSLSEIFKQPRLILAITAAAISYSIMSLLMTATPLSMHEIDQYSLDATTRVLQTHILAMYVPSLFSGMLIARFGAFKIIKAGLTLMATCLAIGWGKPEFIHYLGTLIFLGVGWNFLFLGGTTLLTQSYNRSERFKVQAVNDFIVFGLQAVGSLSAGFLLITAGWNGVIAFALPGLLILFPAIVIAGRVVSDPHNEAKL